VNYGLWLKPSAIEVSPVNGAKKKQEERVRVFTEPGLKALA